MGHWTERLVEIEACADAVAWAKQYPTPAKAWEACQRPDWMLWVAGKLAKSQAEKSAVVLAAAACARTALKYVPAGESRPLAAIEAAEQWAKDPSEENMAAWAAAGAAWAAWAAWAARDAARAAAEAAAWAAGAAAGDAAGAAAGDAANREMADVVRSFVQLPSAKTC